jgi:diketogulonate reductase-like aldo/keto reductase
MVLGSAAGKMDNMTEHQYAGRPVAEQRVSLNDGHTIPAIGFGTSGHQGSESAKAVGSALEGGYRLIDTALRYDNEDAVGQAIGESPVPRDDIVVTSKIPGRYQGYDEAWTSLWTSCDDLGIDRLDLLLIHWPLPRLDRYVDTWRAMIDMKEQGKVGSIGVSNFNPEHIARLQTETGVTPAVNQIELHPYFIQPAAREFHFEQGIVTQAWSPLGHGGDLLTEPVLSEIAGTHHRDVGQIVLAWHRHHDVVPLPASVRPQRQRSNLDLDVTLTAGEIGALDQLDRGRLRGQDPNVYEEF